MKFQALYRKFAEYPNRILAIEEDKDGEPVIIASWGIGTEGREMASMVQKKYPELLFVEVLDTSN